MHRINHQLPKGITLHDPNWHSNTVMSEHSAAQEPLLNHANEIGWTRVLTSEAMQMRGTENSHYNEWLLGCYKNFTHPLDFNIENLSPIWYNSQIILSPIMRHIT